MAGFSFIGNGSWGTALAVHLAKQGHAVSLWGRETDLTQILKTKRENTRYLPGIPLPENIQIEEDLIETVQKHPYIVIAVPSHAFVSVLKQIQPYWTANQALLWVTKGVDPEQGTLLQYFAETILGKTVPLAMLSGPSFAKEVGQGLPTAVVIASNQPAWGETLVDAFSSQVFRAYLSDDLIGLQVGGLLKNVIAVAAGISDALGFGANARSALIARGLAEMIRFGQAMGAKPETLIGLAGCGDMILTCTDNQSRNRRFGLALGAGKTQDEALKEIGQVVEAVHNIDQVYALAQAKQLDLPIVEAVHAVLHGKTQAETAVSHLFERPLKKEYTELGKAFTDRLP